MVREAICTLRDAPNAKLYGIANGKNAHLNLLQMTAMMSRTSTVMIAMVMMRFVAMLFLR